MLRPRELPHYPRQQMDPLQAFVASPSSRGSSIPKTKSEHLATWSRLSPSHPSLNAGCSNRPWMTFELSQSSRVIPCSKWAWRCFKRSGNVEKVLTQKPQAHACFGLPYFHVVATASPWVLLLIPWTLSRWLTMSHLLLHENRSPPCDSHSYTL